MLNESSLQVSKNRLSTLTKAIGIHPGEGLPTALLFGQAFGLGMMMFTLFTAANALFLTEFGAEAMPYVYIVAAVVNVSVGLIFTWLQRHLSFSRLLISTLVFLVVTILFLRLGLGLRDVSIGTGGLTLTGLFIFALPVWLRLVWVLGNLVLWTQAGRLFNVRQSKRLFALIMSGAVFAIIMSGLVISPLIDIIGPSNLLFISSGCLGAILGLLLLTIYRFRNQLDHDEQSISVNAQPQKQWGFFLRNRYIILIFAYSIFSTLGTYVLDFAFFTGTTARYTDLNVLARFLGNYMGIVTLIMLVVSLAAGPFLSRYGVKFGLWINPGFVAVGTFLIALILVVFGPVGSVFWLVVFTKASDDILFSATTSTSVRILYQPLPIKHQVPLQTAVESIITPLSMGMAGLILLLLRAVGISNTLPIIYLLLAIIISWAGVSLLLSREYSGALKQALTKRRISEDTKLLLSDKASLDVVRQALTNDQADVVIYAMNLLEEDDLEILPNFLPDLLNHPQIEVRLAVLERIERYRLTPALVQLQHMLRSEEDVAIRGAVLRTLAAVIGPEFVHEAETYFNAPNPTIQREAMVGLLRYGELEGVLSAGQKLLHLVNSPHAAERILAAQVLSEAGLETYYHPLEKLLHDKEVPVRQAALRAAGQLQNPALWPLVAKALTLAETRQLASDALIKGGAATLPVLSALFDDPNADNNLRTTIARIAGRIGGLEPITFLHQQISFPDQAVRTQILLALSHCRYQATAAAIPQIQAQIKVEAGQATWILATMIDLGEDEVVVLLQEALYEALFQTQNRLFYLLSYLYDSQSILQAQAHLTASSQKKAYALEMLDILLDQEAKQMIFPLVDDSLSLKQRLARLNLIVPQPRLNQAQRLKEIIQTPETESSRWVKACALYVVGELGLKALSDPLISMLTRPDSLLQETAAQALYKIDPQLAQIQNLKSKIQNGFIGERLMLSTIERVLFLRSAEIFNQLSGEALVWLAQVAQELHVTPGERFIQQGDPGDSLYIIVAGQVDVTLESGKKIESLGEKRVIGEMALFSKRHRMANCVAVTDVTLLRISREDFHALLSERSELALGVIEILAHRLEAQETV